MDATVVIGLALVVSGALAALVAFRTMKSQTAPYPPCRRGMEHAKPCGPTGDPFYCACGCSGDDRWCMNDA